MPEFEGTQEYPSCGSPGERHAQRIKAYSTEAGMSPQGRVPGSMAGLKAQDDRVQDPELSPPCLPSPRLKPQPASVPGRKTWEGKGTRLPHSVLELENPVREQGPPSPGSRKWEGRPHLGTGPFIAQEPRPLINVADPGPGS